jgi:hypothetical protein
MGLGFQLLLIALCAWFDRASWALLLFVAPLNIYWAMIMLIRYWLSHRATGQIGIVAQRH